MTTLNKMTEQAIKIYQSMEANRWGNSLGLRNQKTTRFKILNDIETVEKKIVYLKQILLHEAKEISKQGVNNLQSKSYLLAKILLMTATAELNKCDLRKLSTKINDLKEMYININNTISYQRQDNDFKEGIFDMLGKLKNYVTQQIQNNKVSTLSKSQANTTHTTAEQSTLIKQNSRLVIKLNKEMKSNEKLSKQLALNQQKFQEQIMKNTKQLSETQTSLEEKLKQAESKTQKLQNHIEQQEKQWQNYAKSSEENFNQYTAATQKREQYYENTITALQQRQKGCLLIPIDNCQDPRLNNLEKLLSKQVQFKNAYHKAKSIFASQKQELETINYFYHEYIGFCDRLFDAQLEKAYQQKQKTFPESIKNLEPHFQFATAQLSKVRNGTEFNSALKNRMPEFSKLAEAKKINDNARAHFYNTLAQILSHLLPAKNSKEKKSDVDKLVGHSELFKKNRELLLEKIEEKQAKADKIYHNNNQPSLFAKRDHQAEPTTTTVKPTSPS